MSKKHILCASLSIPLLLSGCVAPVAVGGISAVGLSAAEDRGVGGVMGDQALRMKLNYELVHELPDFSGIELTVYKKRVLLTGLAANKKVKEKAITLTKKYPGVKEVIDGLNVSGSDRFSNYSADAWITTKLKTSLYGKDNIIAPNYVVRTFDKVVYIFGTAQTAMERDRVVEIASDIKGVRRVVDLIEICHTS